MYFPTPWKITLSKFLSRPPPFPSKKLITEPLLWQQTKYNVLYQIDSLVKESSRFHIIHTDGFLHQSHGAAGVQLLWQREIAPSPMSGEFE